MRTIKFRGKRKGTGKWVYGDLVRNVEGAFAVVPPFQMYMNNVCSNYEVETESVGQFTGLHDKNGKEIYEGDVVRYSDTMDFFFISPVLFKDGCFCMETKCGTRIEFSNKGIYQDYLCTINYDIEYEVIGSIHDTPNC